MFKWIRNIIITSSTLFVFLLMACEDEKNDPKYTINGTVEIIDADVLHPSQLIKFGVFSEDGFRTIQQTSLTRDGDESFSFQTVVEEGFYVFKIFISENDAYKSGLHVFNESEVSQNLELDAKGIKVLRYQTIQEQVFNRCTQCHGESTELPADLNLLEGESYADLVNVSSKNSTRKRVLPGDAENSFLIQVLYNQDLGFDHSASITATTGDIDLVKKWINHGALND